MPVSVLNWALVLGSIQFAQKRRLTVPYGLGHVKDNIYWKNCVNFTYGNSEGGKFKRVSLFCIPKGEELGTVEN